MGYSRSYRDDGETDDDDGQDEDVITLGAEFDETPEWARQPDLGPDERDADLMDGSWEQRYYAGQQNKRDWSTVYTAVAILVLLAILVPTLLVFR